MVLHYLVVIHAKGERSHRSTFASLAVRHYEAEHAAAGLQQQRRVLALVDIAAHVLHARVAPLLKIAVQPPRRLVQRLHARSAEIGKAESTRQVCQM